GSSELTARDFQPRRRMPSLEVKADNELRLQDTWFLEPLPLPEKQRGPGLFVVGDPTPEYEIFRRYLFDFRTKLTTPLAFLLNQGGEAVKVYANAPTPAQLEADLAQIGDHSKLALPFPGDYITRPKRDFFKFGAAFLWSGYPAQALPYLEEVLRRNPENGRVLVLAGQVHYSLGLTLAKQDRFDEARNHFERAITLRPNYADAINDLGALYMQEGKVKDAVAAFQYGIRVAPDEDILYLNLGRTYTRLGQIDKAREVMQQLLDRKPGDATARHALEELNGR
ncbi:MAG: tetratricopeptide repeat protein, partial [Bryobacteraceae bacterium]